jgi:AraC family transcriptional regulator
MAYEATPDWERHYPNTGHECFDSIAFSSSPSVIVHDSPHRELTAFHHPTSSRGQSVQIEILVENHDLLNLSLMGGGQCARIEGRSIIRYPVRRNALAFVPAGCERRLDVSGRVSTLTVSMPKGLLNRAGGQAAGEHGSGEPGLGVSSEPFSNFINPRLAQLVNMLAGEIGTPGFAADILIDGLMLAIRALMIQRITDGVPDAIDRVHISPIRLARVLEYIEANVAQTITLSDLAAIADLSVFHFSRVFKRQTGSTPYQAVNTKRLDLARALVATSIMPLAEVALACGFSSQAHFSTAFGKHVGMSPGRYRRYAMH